MIKFLIFFIYIFSLPVFADLRCNKVDPLKYLKDIFLPPKIEFCNPKSSELIDINYFTSRTNVEKKYSLKRGNNKILIGINPDFSAGEKFDRDLKGSSLKDHYQKKLDECLRKVNPKLVPAGFPKTEIYRDSNAPKTEISIADRSTEWGGGHRSHSREWASNINCPTIVHEILHLLGLCDEYVEPGKFSCRKIGPEDSVMSNQEVAMGKVFGGTRIKTCKCLNLNDIQCKKEIDSWDGKGDCPVSTQQTQVTYYTAPTWGYQIKGGGSSSVVIDKDAPPDDSSASILTSVQVNVILFPNCAEKNQDYYDCVDGAYKNDLKVCKSCKLKEFEKSKL